jgi:hypothetical protein
MTTMLCCVHSFPTGDLCHPPHSSTPQSRILVAIPPTVYCSLNETTLASQTWIQLSQRPTHSIAFSLIVQPIALVLILWAACSWIHAILSLEVLRKRVGIYRFNITADSILHLDTVSGVLECDPLHTILVLSHNEWSRRGNRTRGGIGIDTGTSGGALVHARSRWTLWWS